MPPFAQDLAYIVASVLFIVGLKQLSSAATARRGNLLSACGMLLAVIATLVGAGFAWTCILVECWWVGGSARSQLVGSA